MDVPRRGFCPGALRHLPRLESVVRLEPVSCPANTMALNGWILPTPRGDAEEAMQKASATRRNVADRQKTIAPKGLRQNRLMLRWKPSHIPVQVCAKVSALPETILDAI